jgi:hypothetical protein
VYSQQSIWFSDQPRDHLTGALDGWYQALVESRIPFEMAHDRLLDEEHLDPFKTLILPNLAALSDLQCEQLRAFVRRGGSVVATGETSLSDEMGEWRDDFGLADLFGVSFVERRPGPVKNSYLTLEHESAGNHPVLRGMEDAPRIIHGVWQLDVRPTAEFPNPPVTLVPAYPDLPMEKVFMRAPKSDMPQIFLREIGKGRVAYFPWDIDRTFWDVLAPDHLRLMRNTIEWATNEQHHVTVEGPGVLDVTVWEQTGSMTVHLVNLTNPMMMKGPVRELIPVAEQRVRVRLPEGRVPRAVHLLVAGTTPDIRRDGAMVELVVPSILAHEVVAIDLAPA